MGGQTIVKNGYIIDTKFLNRILHHDKINNLVTVEPGLTWSELINYLNDYGYSPSTLQSYSSFSIGGSISVNAHGITNDCGVYESIHEIRLLDHNGKKLICRKDKNKHLFSLIMGGYGLFGIIYQVTLRIVPNVKMKLQTKSE